MKVALINNSPNNIATGRYIFSLYRSLNKLNKKNTVFDHFLFDNERKALCKLNGEEKVIVKLRKIPFLENEKFIWSEFLFDCRAARFIPSFYDIYHISSQDLSVLTYYKRFSSKKTVITVHDLFYATHPDNIFRKIISMPLYKGITGADAIITVSNYTKNQLVKNWNISHENIFTTYLGVDRDTFRKTNEYDCLYDKYGLKRNCRYILHIGSDVGRKNVGTLIRSFYKLKNEFNDVDDVVLIKINKLSNRNIVLINKLDLNNDIRVLDHVSEYELPLFYNFADVFVFPSIAEGFGFPPLEAMSCGTPVVASNSTAIPEVVGDGGIMVDPYDVDGFASAIYELLNNKNLRTKMIKRALRQSKKFTWDRCADETFKVYEHLKAA
ncbi:glycosyltransferase family 1 protein [Methanothermobacter wolfeii]|uniref:Glycosyltransferase family 1 protein n=1 Tax=Methanothermobacter wolfeii TaxID=145261 RepID=A0A9E7RW29_METWO|nr:glycosyltransferase family 1 protein [Methanothermobacter wolfeii]MDI6603318.1 glycosyltransferase family 1 protein [Patescibacteria group bacterium]MDI6882838.1 glycosyltransferase family 1 protein [Methanothermobacter sp.]UXH32417.1 glycosyltransferase family 4 protein [Methanothermobacter wolfeii]